MVPGTASNNNLISLAYEPALDGLRAIAVVCVLLFHLGVSSLAGGFIGVDVFYVISGYLITKILLDQFQKKKFNYVDFVVRRARRLLPALFLTIIVTLIGAFLVMSPKHFSETANSAIFASLSVSNWFFWLDSGYFSAEKHVRPLLHTWSLGVEVQFYLVWPFVMMAIAYLFERSRWIGLAALAAIGAVGFLASVWAHNYMPSATFYLSVFRVWQFAAGGCIALLLLVETKAGKPIVPEKLHWMFFAIGAALMAISMVLLTSENYKALSAVLPTIAASALIIGIRTPLALTCLGNKHLVHIGKISYSLYLVHWPLIIIYRYWAFRPLNMWEMIILGGLSFLMAELLYRYVETKFRLPWTQGDRSEYGVVGLRTAGIVLAIGVLGSSVTQNDGWHWRLAPEKQLAQLDTKLDLACGEEFVAIGKDGCSFGVPEMHPDITVIGDSHALEFAKGLAPEIQRDEISAVLLRQYGTLPFSGVKTYGGEWEIGNFEDNLSKIQQSPSKVVILHARFGQYWWSSDAEEGRPTWIGFDNGSPQELTASREAFEVGLQNTMEDLSKTGSTVVVVGAIPYPGLDSSQCIVRPKYLISEAHEEKSCEGLTRVESEKRAGAVNAVLKKEVEENGFIFVDPVQIFCRNEDKTCLREIDGRVIYSDGNHLNGVGSSILAKHVWGTVKEAATLPPKTMLRQRL